MKSKKFFNLNILHIFNDGFKESLILLLPFIALDLDISIDQVGLLETARNAMSFLIIIPAAYLANRFGGFRLLVSGLFIYSASYVGISFADSLISFCLFFAMTGLGFGIFHPIAFALISKISEKNERGKNLGNFTAIGDIGRLIVTSAMSVSLGIISWKLSSFIFGLVGLIAFVFFINKLKGRVKNLKIKKEVGSKKISMKKLLKEPKLIAALFTSLLDEVASSTIYLFIPFLILSKGFDKSLIGYFVVLFFLGSVVGKTGFGRLVDKFGGFKVFIFSEVSMVILILLLVSSSNFFVLVVLSLFLGATTKGTIPQTLELTSKSVDHIGSYDQAMGLRTFLLRIGVMISPFVYGLIAEAYSLTYSFYIMAALSLLAIVPFMLFEKLSQKQAAGSS